MPKIKTLFCFIVSLSLISCANTFETYYEKDKNTDYSLLKTYAWYQGKIKIEQNEQSREIIKDAVTRDLSQKGFTHSADNPDFTIALFFGAKNKIARKSMSARAYYYGKTGGDTYVISEAKQGTLTIDFTDPHTKKLIWRGSTRVEFEDVNTLEERKALISAAVAAVMQNFPPPTKS